MINAINEIIKAVREDNNIKITNESTLAGDLDLDSFSMVSVISQIEDKFGVSISDQELMQMKTIADVIDVLKAKLIIQTNDKKDY